MANVLTSIIRNINTPFAEILEENAAINRLVDTDFSSMGAAVGQIINTPFTPVLTASDIVPAAVPTYDGFQTVTTVPITIIKNRRVPFNLTGDDYLALQNPTQTPGFIPNSLKEAIRVMRNEIASFAYLSIAAGATGAVGAAGSDPFTPPTAIGAILPNVALGMRLLNDSLAPKTDRYGITTTGAWSQLAQNPILIEVNKSGNDEMLRGGTLGKLQGADWTYDTLMTDVTIGTASGYLLNVATAVGDATLNLKTGTGTILPGDLIQIAGDSSIYVAGVTPSGFSAPGVLTLSVGTRPGKNCGYVNQVNAIGAAVTVIASGSRMPLFHKMAFKLVVRPSAQPPNGGDQAVTSDVFIDEKSGLAMRIAYYKLYNAEKWELQCAYGGGVLRPELSKVMIGL